MGTYSINGDWRIALSKTVVNQHVAASLFFRFSGLFVSFKRFINWPDFGLVVKLA